MRINKADIDLWRVRQTREGHKLNEVRSIPVLDRRPDVEEKRPILGRRSQVKEPDGLNATPPLNKLLEQTSGNVAILRYLIKSVLPALPISEDVRQCANSLFIEDMDHHLRVLDAESRDDSEMEIDGKLGQS